MLNEIVINNEEIENFITSLNKNSIDFNDVSGNINQDFYGATSSGLLEKNTDKIAMQLNSVSRSLSNIQNIVNENNDKMFSFDNMIANKIDEIEIPQDYYANNSSKVNTYTQTLVAKLDGKSVNNGKEVHEFNDLEDSVVNNKELKNIQKDDTVEQRYDDMLSIRNQEELFNIFGKKTQEANEIEDSVINKEKLEDIHKEDTSEKIYDDKSRISNQQNLSNINKNVTEEQIYDDNSIIRNKELIKDMRNKTIDTPVIYDDFSRIENSPILFNINKNNTFPKEQINQLNEINNE